MTTGNPDSIEGVAPGKRAALYLRTSTADQHLENQRPELLRIAEQRDLGVVCVYQEQRGAAKQRPALDSMLVDGHAGRFDYLLIWAIDRIDSGSPAMVRCPSASPVARPHARRTMRSSPVVSTPVPSTRPR